MTTVALAEVEAIRNRIARAHQRAAERFRETFVAGRTPPTAHLELLASALIERAEGVRVHGRPSTVENDLVTAQLANFDVDRTPAAIFEYWLIISEISSSAAWHMTRLIATAAEYDAALRRMKSPQIVRALIGSFLPSADVRDDGTAFLEVTVYTRAEEERIERRQVLLDSTNEFHFHGRELIAEGSGGISLRNR